MLQIVILALYTVAILFIFLYSMVQIHLSYLYVRIRRKEKGQTDNSDVTLCSDIEVPFITVQLPIYNEKYVVKRLIASIAAFDYPQDKFEIQVLDDSNDETVEILDECVEEHKKNGIDISLIRRPNRVGFKAGALEYGLDLAKGNFIAIFDADFVPEPDFLKKTIKHFDNEKVGVVQTRWEHLNENYSLLTKLQAFGLDAHFSVEQKGRNSNNYFINFNGTGGIWRKECIVDAGGWQHDTLTEDLDLSYRAQMKGWKFKYLEEVGTPAELPAQINALKSQQFRWTKGAAENARKNLLNVLKSNAPFSKKIHAFFHLMNSFIFICIVVVSILSIPILYIKSQTPELKDLFTFASFSVLSFVFLGFFYFVAHYFRSQQKISSVFSFLVHFPLFLSMSMGISLHNALAVIQGISGKKTPFVRTPKFNINGLKGSWKNSGYENRSISILSIMEGIFALYFFGGIGMAFYLGDYGLLPFHLMLAFGFGIVFYYSVKHSTFVK